MDTASAQAEPEQETSVNDQREPEVLATLMALKDCFDSKIRYDAAKERQIEALHLELESHRQGLYQQILRPVLTDLVGLYDEVANQAATTADALLEMIEGVLGRYDVTKYHCDGDVVDRTRQRVIDVEPTGDAELSRHVARRLRPGFEVGGKVLRPEWVIAYRYAADSESGS